MEEALVKKLLTASTDACLEVRLESNTTRRGLNCPLLIHSC
jgi:hypothetical protein